jgi:DNA-binding response OmpR family regulator
MTEPESLPFVLVIDLDPATHLIAEKALLPGEFPHFSARTTETALKMAERRAPSVLIVDEGVAGLGHVVDRLRTLAPHLRVIVLLNQAPSLEISARLARLGSVLHKPLEAGRLRSMVRTVARLAAMTAGVAQMHVADHTAAPPRQSAQRKSVPPRQK